MMDSFDKDVKSMQKMMIRMYAGMALISVMVLLFVLLLVKVLFF